MALIEHITLPDGNTYDFPSGSDANVTQTASDSSNANYELLMSSTNDNTTRTEGARKTSNATLNPSTGNMTIAGRLTDVNGVQSIKHLFKSEYDALSLNEKLNGTTYHIKDSTEDMHLIDRKVRQSPITSGTYPVLLSGSVDASVANLSETYKSGLFKYSPASAMMQLSDPTPNSLLWTKYSYNEIKMQDVDAVLGGGILMTMTANDIEYTKKWGGIDTSLNTSLSNLDTNKADTSDAIKDITRSGTTFTATRADDTTFTFTQQDNDTTYTFATGDNNGQIKVTPSGGTAQNLNVKGLGNSAYVNKSDTYNATGTTTATTTAVYNARKDVNNSLIATTSITFAQTNVSSKNTARIAQNISKSGYTALGLICVNTGNGNCYPVTMYVNNGNQAVLTVYNTSSSTITVTPTAVVLWKRNNI